MYICHTHPSTDSPELSLQNLTALYRVCLQELQSPAQTRSWRVRPVPRNVR